MVYPFFIFLNFQTNISKCLIQRISQSQIFVSAKSLGISFHSATGRLGSLAAPSDPGYHGHLCRTLHRCYAPLLSRSHRKVTRTRFAPPKVPPKTATTLLSLLWMICHPMFQFGEIAEVMFRLFSHLYYCRSCLVRSPN